MTHTPVRSFSRLASSALRPTTVSNISTAFSGMTTSMQGLWLTLSTMPRTSFKTSLSSRSITYTPLSAPFSDQRETLLRSFLSPMALRSVLAHRCALRLFSSFTYLSSVRSARKIPKKLERLSRVLLTLFMQASRWLSSLPPKEKKDTSTK